MKWLCLSLLLFAAPAFAGDPDPGTGKTVTPVTEAADPDQPQLNPWCAGCRAGAWWLCFGCGLAHAFNMGDLP